MKRLILWSMVLSLIIVGLIGQPAQAQDGYEDLPLDEQYTAAESAATWLQTQQRADNGWGISNNPSDPALTAEVLFALATLDYAQANPGYDFLAASLNNAAFRESGMLGIAITAFVAGQFELRAISDTNPAQTLLATQDNNGVFVSDSSIRGHCYAMIGLYNSRVTIPTNAVNALLASQNDDGGWSETQNAPSDTITTALCIQALAGLEDNNGDDGVELGVEYLLSVQNKDSAFPFQEGEESDLLSTAYAAQALIAASIDPYEWEAADLYEWLLDMQDNTGAFDNDVQITAAVIPALVLIPLNNALFWDNY